MSDKTQSATEHVTGGDLVGPDAGPSLGDLLVEGLRQLNIAPADLSAPIDADMALGVAQDIGEQLVTSLANAQSEMGISDFLTAAGAHTHALHADPQDMGGHIGAADASAYDTMVALTNFGGMDAFVPDIVQALDLLTSSPDLFDIPSVDFGGSGDTIPA